MSDAAREFIDRTGEATPFGTPGGINKLAFYLRPAVAEMMERYATERVVAEWQRVASRITDIARRIGPARLPESIKEELERLASQYEFWSKSKATP